MHSSLTARWLIFLPAFVSPTLVSPQNDGTESGKRPQLSVHIIMRPTLARPPPSLPPAVASEEATIANRAVEWRRELAALSHCRDREYKSIAFDVRGSGVFLCRFIAKLPPPPRLRLPQSEAALHRLLRFVSLVPFLEDWALFRRREDVWSTAQEFLDICAGDYEEHAVLLCNYFLFLGVQAFVALGNAATDAQVAFVVTKGGCAAYARGNLGSRSLRRCFLASRL